MNNFIADVCVLAYAIAMTGMVLTLCIWIWQDRKGKGKK